MSGNTGCNSSIDMDPLALLQFLVKHHLDARPRSYGGASGQKRRQVFAGELCMRSDRIFEIMRLIR
jgi:hypothetical protein